jgi:hypothetical protein
VDLAPAALRPAEADAQSGVGLGAVAADPADLDAVLDRITALKASQKAIDAELAPLLDALSSALDAGELDASFCHNDFSFCWSAGRTSYDYSEALRQQEQLLKQAQKNAIASGQATARMGRPFWTVKAPRPI